MSGRERSGSVVPIESFLNSVASVIQMLEYMSPYVLAASAGSISNAVESKTACFQIFTLIMASFEKIHALFIEKSAGSSRSSQNIDGLMLNKNSFVKEASYELLCRRT